MSSCDDLSRLALAFLEGEMSPEEEARLRQHLSGCSPCLDFLDTYRATPELCRKALARKMPTELSRQLTEYLRANIKSRP